MHKFIALLAQDDMSRQSLNATFVYNNYTGRWTNIMLPFNLQQCDTGKIQCMCDTRYAIRKFPSVCLAMNETHVLASGWWRCHEWRMRSPEFSCTWTDDYSKFYYIISTWWGVHDESRSNEYCSPVLERTLLRSMTSWRPQTRRENAF